MRKAESSLGAARLLFVNGYTDEACSRAYYAMFDAARAALILANAPVEAEIARTHRGLMSAFSQHIVKSGLVPQRIGRFLGQAQHVRLIADYNGDPVEAKAAAQMIAWAEDFIEAVRGALPLERENPGSDPDGPPR
jgi:uncharacterized protein (UPF0332 family)